MDLCTIFLRSETARVRALARSFAQHHPGSPCTAVLLDGDPSDVETHGEFEVLGRDQLEVPDADVAPAVLEHWVLRRALIPGLLARAVADDGVVLYADPSIRFYAPLDDLAEQADRQGWMLLATLASLPATADPVAVEDRVGDRGAFDPSLLVASGNPEVRSALRWWAGLATHAPAPGSTDAALGVSWWWDFEEGSVSHVPPSNGAEGPHWLDLAAGLTKDFGVIRDPGICARPRELAPTEITEEDGVLFADGSPLRCFNFSGYSAAEPFRFGGDDLEEQPAPLRRIAYEYATEIEQLGDREFRQIPYGLAELPDGTQMDGRMRKLYWQAVHSGAVQTSVFTERGNREFINWLREPGLPAGPPIVNRYVLQVYKERPDLQRAMSHTDPNFGDRLASWLSTQASTEIDFPPQVVPDELRPAIERDATNGEVPAPPPNIPRWKEKLAPSLLEPGDTWGVNVVGFMRSDFGIAHAARLVIEALDVHRIPLLPIHDLRLARFKTEGSAIATLGAEAAKFPVTLMVMNGDFINDLRVRGEESLLADHYTIALWFWETDQIPEDWTRCLDVVDEIWVASDYVGEAVARRASVPIHKISLPVHVPPVVPTPRAELEIPEGDYLFMYVFDYGSIGARKNPLGVVEAFRRAFEPGEGASLLLKSSYSFFSRNEYAAVRAAAEGHPDIHMIEERLPTERKNALLASCDCYVSLHRSEGFGLSQAEAMYLGKPVILTGYGGVLEFASSDNSYLVGYDEVEVGPNRDPYGEHDHWAEPRIDEAAKLMRHVFENPEEASQAGARAARDIRRHLSADAAGKTMEERLVRIRRMLRAEIGAGGPAAASVEPGAGEGARPPLIARLRAKLRIRTRLRALFRRVPRPAAVGPPPDPELAVWKREQELRLAALSSQLLGHLREIERRVSRAAEESGEG